MKNKYRISGWIAKFTGLSLAFAALGLAAGSESLWANAELDRQYALETVGFLKSWDNVDGLFAEYVAAAYRDYFSTSSRFVLQDLSKSDPILTHSKIPYNKVIEDPQILGQLARATRTQTIIRTKIYKEGAQYRFTLDWLHAPKMDLIATESFTLEEQRDGVENSAFKLNNIKGSLVNALDRMIKKLPFSGTVTGRDNNSVTLNVGFQSDIQPGDVLVIGTLDDVKKHPLLRAIVDWRFSDVGRVEVDQVDRGISFAKVIEEEPGRKIGRYQKIIQILRKPVTQPSNEVIYTDAEERRKAAEEPPRLGWASGGLWLWNFSRQYSNAKFRDPATDKDVYVSKDGGGTFYGAKAEGQLWLTHEFFSDLQLGYGLFSYSQKDLPANSTSTSSSNIPEVDAGSGSAFNFKLAFGYNYLVNGDFFGPKGWVKVGYHSISYSLTSSVPSKTLPASSAHFTTPTAFNSVFLGIGGDLPIRNQWGVRLNLDFGLINNASESDENSISGSATSASDVEFTAGVYYRWTPKISFKLDFDIMSSGADFSSGSTLTHKITSINPALVMYF